MLYQFADCVLDSDTLRLTRGGSHVPVEPQVYDLLVLLASRAGKVVSRDEMIEAVWNGRIVSDATISARINAARKAVGDDGHRQEIIRTLNRRGIELHVAVEQSGGPSKGESAPAAAVTQTQKVKYARSADGTRIAYGVSGKGPPLLRAGHHLTHLDLDWHSRLWRPMWDAFGSQHTLVRFDERGTGLSDHAIDGVGISDFVGDLKAVADAAGLERFALLAHLQSTPVALRFIAENPGRVSRLVIHEGYCRGRSMRDGARQSANADPVVALMQNGWGDPENGFMRAWASMIVPNAPPEDVTELIGLLSSAAPAGSVVPARRIIDRFTAEDCLDKIKIPTLIVHARGDTIHPLDEARVLAMGIEGAELVVVESSSTICIPCDPTWQEQVDTIMSFLQADDA
jgi:DNA-binding winged helix-turn-helix (wHTH) protein/pimeloyl-ACP methyl ester carboxylesterase